MQQIKDELQLKTKWWHKNKRLKIVIQGSWAFNNSIGWSINDLKDLIISFVLTYLTEQSESQSSWKRVEMTKKIKIRTQAKPDTLVKTPSLTISPAQQNSKGRNNRAAVCNAPLRSPEPRPFVRTSFSSAFLLHHAPKLLALSSSLRGKSMRTKRSRVARAIAADKLANETALSFALHSFRSLGPHLSLFHEDPAGQTISFNGLSDLTRSRRTLTHSLRLRLVRILATSLDHWWVLSYKNSTKPYQISMLTFYIHTHRFFILFYFCVFLTGTSQIQ